MAGVREHLTDTSDKLRLAFSDLKAVDEELAPLTAGVNGLPLSEAAARVSQGARTVAALASKVLKAAEAAEAAAGKASAAAVTPAEEAKAAAEQEAATAAEAAAVAARKAEAAAVVTSAAAALEVKIEPPLSVDHTLQQIGGGGGNVLIGRQGAGSSSGVTVDHGRDIVTVEADESGLSADTEGEDVGTPPICEGGSAGSADILGNATPGQGEGDDEQKEMTEEQERDDIEDDNEDEDGEEEGQEEEYEEEEEMSTQGKRKLPHKGNKSPRPQSIRAAGGQQHNYTESPTRDPSKRQRKAPMPMTRAGSGSGGAEVAPRKGSPATEAKGKTVAPPDSGPPESTEFDSWGRGRTTVEKEEADYHPLRIVHPKVLAANRSPEARMAYFAASFDDEVAKEIILGGAAPVHNFKSDQGGELCADGFIVVESPPESATDDRSPYTFMDEFPPLPSLAESSPANDMRD